MAEGDDLRTWRERLGMTQAELGSRLRPMAAQHTVSRWETGERRIPPGLWQALQWIEQGSGAFLPPGPHRTDDP